MLFRSALAPGDNSIALSNSSTGTTRSFKYAGSTSLSGTGTSSGTFVDRDYDTESGVIARGTATSSSIEIRRNGTSQTFSAYADVVRIDVDGQNLYLGYVDTSGDAWLIYGTMSSGFTELALDTGLSSIDDIDLLVSTGGGLLIAVRQNNTVRWMAVSL